MKLSKSRRLLCTILSAVSACATAILIISLILSVTVTNAAYTEKVIFKSKVAAECEAQLDAYFKVLSTETGIPVRVFEQVKEDFPVADSISKAYNNQFNEDNANLYSKNMVEYFQTLCEEYLSGNNIKYKERNIKAAAEKAARLYSNALGLQNTDGAENKLNSLNTLCDRLSLFSALALLFCALLLLTLYTEKRKAIAYLLSGVSAGAFASLLSSLLLLITNAPSKIILTPAVYASAYQGLMRKELLLLAAASFIAFALAYAALIWFEKKIYKDSLQ